ncbi:MAG TPA: hypothetical protein VLA61_18450 [Ideonella sp.]|uniref:hypothetical protein n=1 Tax=Ideonella sp. TaxID=1929293 RepID=UPI002D13AD18|nr:hypothetical protein [Ideonella sp.]HSI50257.1 hypothetical protein [Ideonella sp.]
MQLEATAAGRFADPVETGDGLVIRTNAKPDSRGHNGLQQSRRRPIILRRISA